MSCTATHRYCGRPDGEIRFRVIPHGRFRVTSSTRRRRSARRYLSHGVMGLVEGRNARTKVVLQAVPRTRSPGSGCSCPLPYGSAMAAEDLSITGEKRWPMAITLLVAMSLPLLLPSRFSLGPDWIVSVIVGILLVALVFADPGRIDRRSTFVRGLSIALVIVLVAGAAGVTARLVVDLIVGGPETNSPAQLLRIGSLVWLYLIISFSFLYWELDGEGPEARARRTPEFPDLAFPEHLNPKIARPGWRPEFFDYLYLGFTNATAFSPTDVMPVARWAKLAMAIQASSSLVVLGLVIARAVNILK